MNFQSTKKPLLRIINRVYSEDLQKRMNAGAPSLDIFLFGKAPGL